MKVIYTVILNLSFVTLTWAQADLLFIVDASGSMAKQSEGQRQIDSARSALKSALSDIPADVAVGLRVYAHRVAQSDKEQSCKDTELLVPIAQDSREKVKSAIDTLQVKGYTPIAYSLEQSKNDFDITRESEKTIILLSDGEETCGGDPVAVVQKLIAEGFKVKVHTIGFMVDSNTAKQLQAVAAAGNGNYYDAKNATELSAAFKEAAKKAKFVEIKENKYGEKTIRGGANFETAVALEPNVEYKLDHVLKQNQYDYFFVDLKAGQELAAEVRTYDKGITITNDGEVKENNNPYAGIKLINSDKSKEIKEMIIGGPFVVKTVSMLAEKEGRNYILIGSEYDPINPDYTTFKYQIVSKGDLDADSDAGSSIDSALNVEFKRYLKNHLTTGDSADIFALKVAKDEQFFVGFIPNSPEYSGSTSLKILGEYKEEIAAKNFEAKQGGKTDPIKADADTTYYIEVSRSATWKDQTLEYTIDFKKISAP